MLIDTTTTLEHISSLDKNVIKVIISSGAEIRLVEAIPMHVIIVDILPSTPLDVIEFIPAHVKVVVIHPGVLAEQIHKLSQSLKIVAIPSDVDPEVVRILPFQIDTIYMGDVNFSKKLIEAIPSHIKRLGIYPGITHDHLRNIPKNIEAIEIYPGVDYEILQSIPEFVFKICIILGPIVNLRSLNHKGMRVGFATGISFFEIGQYVDFPKTIANIDRKSAENILKSIPHFISEIHILSNFPAIALRAIPLHISFVNFHLHVDESLVRAVPIHISRANIFFKNPPLDQNELNMLGRLAHIMRSFNAMQAANEMLQRNDYTSAIAFATSALTFDSHTSHKISILKIRRAAYLKINKNDLAFLDEKEIFELDKGKTCKSLKELTKYFILNNEEKIISKSLPKYEGKFFLLSSLESVLEDNDINDKNFRSVYKSQGYSKRPHSLFTAIKKFLEPPSAICKENHQNKKRKKLGSILKKEVHYKKQKP